MIKIASMVGAPDLRVATLAPFSGDFRAAFQKLATLGFDGVELMVRQPSTLDGTHIRLLLNEYHLNMLGLCTGHIFGEDGLGLIQPDLTINQKAMDRLKEFVDFCATHFPPGMMVNIGRARGVGDANRISQTMEIAVKALQDLADYALPRQVRLILEPITRKEVSFIHTTQDGLEIARGVGRTNFGLMLDTYHMFLEDANLYQSFYEAQPYCWHIHFSDSNRCWPGGGEIDYLRIVKILDDIGYNGYVSLEIKPLPDPESAARLSIEYLRKFIPRAG